MKKVLLILMLGVFAFESSGFKKIEDLNQDCADYAEASIDAENEAYGSTLDPFSEILAWLFYYDLCDESDETLEPIFINN